MADDLMLADERAAPTVDPGSRAFRSLVGSLIAADALGPAAELVDAAAGRAAFTGDPRTVLSLRCARAQIRHQEGRLDEAEDELAPLLDGSRRDVAEITVLLACRVRSTLRLARGDAVGAEVALAPLRDRLDDEPLLRGQLAGVLLAQGRDAEAADAFLAALADDEGRWGVDNPGVAPWRGGAAIALTRLGRRPRAVELAEEEVARARAFGLARPLGRALSALGTALGGEEGLRVHEEAIAVLERSPARVWLPPALLAQGIALRDAGRRVAARRPLGRAGQLAGELGLHGVERDAEAQLAAVAGRARRSIRDGVAVLTPAQRRVAVLVARGHTSPEVAERLGVGRRTVETTLEKVFRKLDVHSRGELRDAMAALDASG